MRRLENRLKNTGAIPYYFVTTIEKLNLLRGSECVAAVHQAQLISKIPHVLKEMYDADLLEGEVIISWAEKASKKYVSKELAKEIRVKAEPFVKWLKEAEERNLLVVKKKMKMRLWRWCIRRLPVY
ncbi:Eukaryotic translation initiation factor 5 [Myotis brandtii]|uniref:Eukaryotic translation initiation factor 5 n=1 Tax=Myotis brandtii TaxID=109478 RepID=S7Q267_MYOBR|nr:Eukaryotic translation initiation factor 5 [Myotis brandtii]